jgi:WD40 repeat protein
LTNESTRTAGFPFDGAARIGNGNLVTGTQALGQEGVIRIFDPANNSVVDSVGPSSGFTLPNSIRMDKTRNEAIVHARQEEASTDTPGRLYKFDVSDDTVTQLDFNEYGQDGADTEKNLAHWNGEQIALLYNSQDNQYRSFDTSSSGLPLLASGSGLGSADLVAFFSAGRFYTVDAGPGSESVGIFTIASDGTINFTGSYLLENGINSLAIDTFSEVLYAVGATTPAHVFALDVSQSTITATEELDDLSVTNANFNDAQVGLYFGPNTLNPE